jgi:hypothetical protein
VRKNIAFPTIAILCAPLFESAMKSVRIARRIKFDIVEARGLKRGGIKNPLWISAVAMS